MTKNIRTAEAKLTAFAVSAFENGMVEVQLRDGVYWLCQRLPEGGFRTLRSVGTTTYPIGVMREEIAKVAAEY